MSTHGPQPDGKPHDLTPSLVVRLRHGDAHAGELLHQLYHEAILRYCWRQLGNVQDAEDALQDTFCNVLKDGQIPDDFRAWVYKIARNQCLMVLRRRGRRKDGAALPSESKLIARTTGITTRLAKHETQARIWLGLHDLPEAYREPLYLRYAHGLSWGEIGLVLELPVSVVKSRLCEGLEKLRGQIALVQST